MIWTCFHREFIAKFLVPWAERQIKTLGEMIAQRRGFRKSIFSATRSLLSNMSSSTVSLTKLTGSTSTNSGVIYIPDAQEMQQRKLADICMIFNIYEMAFNLYYSAKKDFYSESAWIYYAGASEMSAISSYLINKYQHNHFEQAITTYLDTCKSINLATRSAILATELLCQLNRHREAANLFIRMTCDDSDLRSAMFLEQASKCFLSVNYRMMLRNSDSQSSLNRFEKTSNQPIDCSFGTRLRKAAFHYILAGHRYNRCGLKHFALFCYLRYNYSNWDSASDHVNLTIAKLYLAISSGNRNQSIDEFEKGLEIYRKFSHKQIFFTELLWELKKLNSSNDKNPNQEKSKKIIDNTIQMDAERFHSVGIPSIIQVDLVSPDSFYFRNDFSRTKFTQSSSIFCFVDEEVRILFTLIVPFDVTISNIRLIADGDNTPDALVLFTHQQKILLKSNIATELMMKFCSKKESNFVFTGLEYQIDNLKFQKSFESKFISCLSFESVKTLPLISFDIRIMELDLNLSDCPIALRNSTKIPQKTFQTEQLSLRISFRSSIKDYRYKTIKLMINAEASDDENTRIAQRDITNLNEKIDLIIQMPQNSDDQHRIYVKLNFTNDSGQSRTVYREIVFEVEALLKIESVYDSEVITLRNQSSNETLKINQVTAGSEDFETNSILLAAENAAHLLLLDSFIEWELINPNLRTIENHKRCVRHGRMIVYRDQLKSSICSEEKIVATNEIPMLM